MLLIDKNSDFLDYKKEAVVTTPLSEKKLSTTKNITISDEVHKHTEKITTREEIVKIADKFHKHTEKIKTNEEVEKGPELLEDMKEAVVIIRRKDSEKFEGQSEGSTGFFNLNHELKKETFLHLNQTSIKTFMKRTLKVHTWNRIKRFFTVLFYRVKPI